MPRQAIASLPDELLPSELRALVARDRALTSDLLTHLAEVDRRQLNAPAACSSMFVYCVRELGMSEDVAYKRIRAARAAREHPEILELIAQGRLHVAAVVLLAPHLDSPEVKALIAEACDLSKAKVEELLARRFPQADVPTKLAPVVTRAVVCNTSATTSHALELAPGPVAAVATPTPAVEPAAPVRPCAPRSLLP